MDEQFDRLQARYITANDNKALSAHHADQIVRLQHDISVEEQRNAELTKAYEAEAKDVEKLEKRSWKRLMAKAKEGVDEALIREQMEAEAAADEVERSTEELARLRADVARHQAEIDRIGPPDAAIAEAREALTNYAAEVHPTLAGELEAIGADISSMSSGLVELEEARAAGRLALAELDTLEKHLKKAKTTSTWDTWLGGGILMSMSKRDQMKISSEQSRVVAHAIADFDRELDDTEIEGVKTELDIGLQQGLFDVVFDNIFTDLAIDRAIKDAQAQATVTRGKVSEILAVVDGSYERTVERLEQRKGEQSTLLSTPQDRQ